MASNINAATVPVACAESDEKCPLLPAATRALHKVISEKIPQEAKANTIKRELLPGGCALGALLGGVGEEALILSRRDKAGLLLPVGRLRCKFLGRPAS